MANAKYGLYIQEQLTPNNPVDWAADNIKVVLVDTALYAVNINVDQFLSAVPVGARIATSANLAGKTSALGVADANDVTIAIPAAQPSIEALVVYKDTGVDATSKLIAYIDTGTGLPFTPPPGGGNETVQWNAAGIFSL